MVFLISRVLEHSSIYGLACLDHVLSHVDKAATQQVILWSDGPRMFKSTEYLAGSIGALQTHPSVMKVINNRPKMAKLSTLSPERLLSASFQIEFLKIWNSSA